MKTFLKKSYRELTICSLFFTLVLTLSTSCQHSQDYQMKDDIVYTLLKPYDNDKMEQRGDSLYEAGEISDLCRKFYHAFALCSKIIQRYQKVVFRAGIRSLEKVARSMPHIRSHSL